MHTTTSECIRCTQNFPSRFCTVKRNNFFQDFSPSYSLMHHLGCKCYKIVHHLKQAVMIISKLLVFIIIINDKHCKTILHRRQIFIFICELPFFSPLVVNITRLLTSSNRPLWMLVHVEWLYYHLWWLTVQDRLTPPPPSFMSLSSSLVATLQD